MYFLVFTVLACVGVAAGVALSDGDPAVSAAADKVINLCGIRFSYISQNAAFDHCIAGAWRSEGLIALGGVASVLALAGALTVIVPWADRRRVARAGRLRDIPEATARFEALCRESGFTGRRPGLVIAGPRVRQAFTAALPGGRPLIVLPAAVAVAHDDVGRFDPVVLHELAHARARDVSWVSSVRWIGWITVPVFALEVAVNYRGGTNSPLDAALQGLQAGAFVTVAVVIAAGLLRRREIEADRLAVAWQGSPGALSGVLDAGRPPADGGLRGALREFLRPLARHPPIQARITALQDPLGLRDGGFWPALATGVVTALAMNSSFYLADHLGPENNLLPDRVSAATGGILLGFSLTPLLLRLADRARQGAAVPWWQPVAGTAAGILLGSLAAPTYDVYGNLVIFAPGSDLKVAAAAVILTASAGAGMATLAAGLASHALGRYPRHRRPGVAAWVALAVSCCAAAALWPIHSVTEAWGTGVVRLWLTYVVPPDPWHWLALAYPAIVLLLTAKARPRRIRAAIRDAAAAPFVTAVCAAVAGTTLVLPASLPAAGRWLVATIVGWIVLAVLALSGGVAGLARAGLCAWLATVLASAEFFTYGALAGRPHGFGTLSLAITISTVWLFYLALPTSLLALLRIRPLTAARRPWTVPAVAAASAAVLAAVAAGTGIAGPLTATDLNTVRQSAALAAGSPRPTPTIPAAVAGGDPGRVLTASAARRVVRAVGAALSPGWTNVSVVTGSSAGVTTVRPAACIPLQDMSFLDIRPAPLVRAAREYRGPADLIILGSETLTVRVRSYARPIPASLLSGARKDLRTCHRYTVTGTTFVGAFRERARAGPAPDVGVPAWRADVTYAYRALGSAAIFIVITAGHNLILITQQAIAESVLPPSDEAVTRTAVSAAMNALRRR